MLTFGSLFAGIGGFDLAFEQAGMRCAWQVEIDQKCKSILAHHWPSVERMSDVKEITRPKSVDLVCGGFPCQDLSVAGRRAGLDGERSGLWFEFLRIIEEITPQWVVIENVPGLLSSYSGDDAPGDLQPGQRWQTTEESDLSIIFQGLAKCGYWWAYRVLDAQYWRVPQRRRRVFIVASLGDWAGPAKVLFESESSPWDIAPSRETRTSTTSAVARELKESCEPRNVAYRIHAAESCAKVNHAVETTYSRCLDGTGGFASSQGGTIVDVSFVANPLSAHGGRNCAEDTFIPVAFQPRYYTRDNKTGGAPSHTADITNVHKAGDSAPVIAFPSTGGTFMSVSEDVSPTLKVGSGLEIPSPPAIAGSWGVRRFTPLECERLQGFPDGWTDINGMSDSARYRMLGNAVAVPVAQWIGERIIEAHNDCPDE